MNNYLISGDTMIDDSGSEFESNIRQNNNQYNTNKRKVSDHDNTEYTNPKK
jgi:hypothetical protein